MKFSFYSLICKLIFCGFFYEAVAEEISFCPRPHDEELKIHRNDFPWDQSLKQIANLADRLYLEKGRIRNRAYLKNQSFALKVEDKKVKDWDFEFSEIPVKLSLVQTLKNHISKIQKKNFGQKLIYSDIGHTHIFANLKDLEILEQRGISSTQVEFYEFVLHSPNTKFLYHTSEQLRSPKNKEEVWRRNNRTVVGDGYGNIKVVDFTKRITGHNQFFSIYFHANHQGCFRLNETNFDISLSSP